MTIFPGSSFVFGYDSINFDINSTGSCVENMSRKIIDGTHLYIARVWIQILRNAVTYDQRCGNRTPDPSISCPAP